MMGIAFIFKIAYSISYIMYGVYPSMIFSRQVEKLLNAYAGENAGVLSNMARLLTHGALAHTGKMMILAVDQGFEHGPVRSFLMNPDAMDPLYHWNLAHQAGMSAFAAPLGLLEVGACRYAGQIPLILKMNSSHSLGKSSVEKNLSNQAITASIDDALRLGCTGVGFTLYPGSDYALELYEEVKDMIAQAKAKGLVTVVWSYPRGNMPSAGERSLDTIAYGVHTACLLGAHIVKTKLPTADVFNEDAAKLYKEAGIDLGNGCARVRHVMACAFQGRRLVIFSGGETKNDADVLQDIQDIVDGGGHGSIMGRNCFQRSLQHSLDLVQQAITKLKQGD